MNCYCCIFKNYLSVVFAGPHRMRSFETSKPRRKPVKVHDHRVVPPIRALPALQASQPAKARNVAKCSWSSDLNVARK